MKKYNLFALMLLMSAPLFISCSDKDDKVTEENGYRTDRLMTPVFRLQQNNYSGVKGSDDPYGCGRASLFENCPSNHVNDIWLNWYSVEGASAYQIQAQVGVGSWDEKTIYALDTIIPAYDKNGDPVHSFLHEDLAYNQGYLYAIRAISPRGEEYNSKWFGKQKDLGHQQEMSRDAGAGSSDPNSGAINTGMRYDVPTITWPANVTETTVRIMFNQEVGNIKKEEIYKEFLEAGGATDESGENWLIDEIKVEPTNPELPGFTHKLTEQDFANGYVDFEGLTPNAQYIVHAFNNKIQRYYDREYNKGTIRMHGEKGEPIIIKADQTPLDRDSLLTQAFVPELAGHVTRLDTILINYMDDDNVAEGQVFYLEGGKTYYIQNAVSVYKGFTLETNPADIAAGKGRALVYTGVGYSSEKKTGAKNNTFAAFMLSRTARSAIDNGVMLTIDDVIFRNINFEPQVYFSYMDQQGTDGDKNLTITQNYLLNMNSGGLSFSLNKFEISNCTMRGMIRGFMRFQGNNQPIVGQLKVDNCVFYDSGDYDKQGNGYCWFDGPGKNRLSNFYQNVSITNCTFVNSPRRALIGESGNLAWPKGTKWNIRIENNTFINFAAKNNHSTRGTFFETPYAPNGSHFAIKNNLFVWTRKGDSDTRDFYCKGMQILNPQVSYDIADNYSTYVPEAGKFKASDDPKTTRADGMFTGYAFSNDVSGAGYQDGFLNVGGMKEVRIKFGDNRNENETDAVGYQLKAEELFKDPQPLGVGGTKNMHRHNIDGFYYKTDSKVTSHPIYTKGIGDPRWRTGAAWK